MADRKITNCGDCAYAQKTGREMWCPFHDVSVSSRLVCDDFLDQMDSPGWDALVNDIAGNKRKVPQYTANDIFAYIVTAFLFIVYIAGLVYFNSFF